jgi:predicted peptidase
MKTMLRLLVTLTFTTALAAQPAVFEELELEGGQKLAYALVLPKGFDPVRSYPALLALPPGGQDRAMVEAGLERYWGEAAAERGWIVVSPVAPRLTFFQGAETQLPALLEHVRSRYTIERGRFHLAGVSMGGISAFRLALDRPELYAARRGS